MPKTKRPKCLLAGCNNKVRRYDAKYCSPTCSQLSSRKGSDVTDIRSGAALDKVLAGSSMERDRDLEKVKLELKRYKSAYEDFVKEAAEDDRLFRLFNSAVERMPALPKEAMVVQPKPIQKGVKRSTEVPVLLHGDQQIGEEVSLEETFGINAYNFSVYQARLEYLEDRIVDILTEHQNGNFEEFVVLDLGDNISGRIHAELEKHGAQHVIDQVYLGALTKALFYRRLLARLRPRGVKKMRIVGVSGNHGRLDHHKESKKYYKNFDYMFNSIAATALRDVKEIEYEIPQCLFALMEVAGHSILVSHGHELPPSSLGIPLYSINRGSAAYQELLSIADKGRFDYWVMGHYHRPMELDQAIVNGTMCGITEYGIGKFKPIVPMQKLLGFHPKHGRTFEYQIKLDKVPEPKVYTFDHEMDTENALELLDKRYSELK